MNSEITQLIERYLSNELSESDRAVFEQKLAENPKLQQEIALQQQIHEGAKRAAVRTSVKQVAKKFHFRKKIVKTAIITALVGTLAAASWLVWKNVSSGENGLSESELAALIEQLDKLAPIEFVPTEYFDLSEKDTVVLSENGVLLSVPDDAFLLNGKVYAGRKVIQWQEAMDAATIVKGGLSTMSGDRMLETQGMFGVQAFTPEGKKLDVNPKVGLYVQVPVDELKEGMQLFEGKPGKNGVVDWQNPQPLAKLPVSANMSELNFYPPDYELKLNELKWNTGKKDRDSLYLSFEEGRKREYCGFFGQYSGYDDWEFSFSCEMRDNNYGTFIIEGDYKADISSVAPDFIIEGYDKRIQFKKKTENYHFEKGRIRGKTTYDVVLEGTDEIQSIFLISFKRKINGTVRVETLYETNDYDHYALDEFNGFLYTKSNHIPPARVLAFWNPKFNKTILATRDFEKRMHAVHGTCCKDVLEKYTNNLNKPLYEIDEIVAAMGYPAFREFALERVGGIQLDNAHMNNLAHFYDQAIARLQEEVKKDKAFLKKLEMDWDRKVRKERHKEENRAVKREAKALQEEYDLNMRNVCRQLGKSVGFQIHGGGTVYNIDKYVMDATVARTSTVITDPESGKTAKITYNDFSVTVDKPEQYERLFLYLFPKELNSFQRIDPKDKGMFDYPLNNDIQYDLAVIGINETGYFIHQRTGLNSGALGTVALEKVSETTFNSIIEGLNTARNEKPMAISDELKWLTIEKENYKVQRQRRETEAFRKEIRQVIFPCELGEAGYPIDSTARQ